MLEYLIRNVISTSDLKQVIEITKFNDYEWGRYDIENNYNGKVGYVKDGHMEGRVTVFVSGKLISTGAKSLEKSKEQLYITKDILLKNEFIKNTTIECKIQNIVVTSNFNKYIDFRIVIKKKNAIYEPEQFPGLIYKPTTGSTCIIFSSGKIVITGSKSEKQVIDTIQDLKTLLN